MLGSLGSAEALKVLAAWLPAREGRRVRIRFRDGTEIEATTVKELEKIKQSFLAPTEDATRRHDRRLAVGGADAAPRLAEIRHGRSEAAPTSICRRHRFLLLLHIRIASA